MKTLYGFWRSVAALVVLVPALTLAGPVDINSADAQTLARELQGVGLARAQAIVAYREKNGPFKSPADLAKVKGIGMKVVEDNRDNIRIGRQNAADKSGRSKTEAAADSPQRR